MPRRPRATEVDAYIFIKDNLKTLGWDTRNPARVPAGQVYTQNECLADSEISRWLLLRRPEAVVKTTETDLWVIEAKRSHGELDQALREAEDYANTLNASERICAKFATGVAGNELDSFLIRTRYFNGSAWVPVTLNGVVVTGLLSPDQTGGILASGNPDLSVPTIDEKLFLSRANRINEILHLGAVNPHQRAGVMAALLLATLGDTQPNIQARSPSVLIGDINARVADVLRRQAKPEFYEYIKIDLPTTEDNHIKFRQALVDTLQELNLLNIRSAMNSGADWLGAFYEVFLKYANWARDLGIVLTPRHITRFAADVLDVQHSDIVYDPACGTGGFLVAALDYVKRRSTMEQLDRFKQRGIFGIEQDSGVAALAVVNMIFRGDGKNNIREGNCFSTFLSPGTEAGIPTARFVNSPVSAPPITKIMMNPPFALKSSDEKESKFVDQALGQLEHGGILFSILPYSTMVRSGSYQTWRKDALLPYHTLLAVATFPPDLFYPVGVITVGIFIKKGTPHPREQPVLWVRAVNDGLQISKGKRLPNNRAYNDLERVRGTLRAFLRDPSQSVTNIQRLQKAAPINFDDAIFELVPENYLDEAPPTDEDIRGGIAEVVRECAAFLIRTGR